jgi:hypothetical protein
MQYICSNAPYLETVSSIHYLRMRRALVRLHTSVMKINRLVFFREIIAVYCDNYLKDMICRQNAELFVVKASGTYSNHCALRGKWKYFTIHQALLSSRVLREKLPVGHLMKKFAAFYYGNRWFITMFTTANC